MPPEFPWCDLVLVVRSGLITFQLWPPFSVMKTTCAPTYTRLWLCGEMASGVTQSQRYFMSAGAQP